MSMLTDQDWEQINAYHDGELPPDAARTLKARIAEEPDLAAALASIADVSSSLGAMRPKTGGADLAHGHSLVTRAYAGRSLSRWLAGGALAASLLAALVFGSGQLGPDRPIDVHLSLANLFASAGTGSIEASAVSGPVDLPDLTGANLSPVTMRDFNDGSVAHYVGRNGCRLSYFRVRGQLQTPDVTEGQSAVWTTSDGMRHGIIATGMDPGKFAAISAYLQIVSRKGAETEVYAALTTATRAAIPCVG
ncbi:MAG: hypothetical protein AAF317_11555 [Pseudomonadota bacterium]